MHKQQDHGIALKEIHFEDLIIDLEGSNTQRHKGAGSLLVTARGYFETDLLFPEALTLEQILSYYDHDFVIMEGVTDSCAPKIITAHTAAEVVERIVGVITKGSLDELLIKKGDEVAALIKATSVMFLKE